VAAPDVAGDVAEVGVELAGGLSLHALITPTQRATDSSRQTRTTFVEFITFMLISGLLREFQLNGQASER
jgi:hypothetical protein